MKYSEAGKGDSMRSGSDQVAYSNNYDRIFRKPVIVAVAIKTLTETYSLPKPNRHHNVLKVMDNLYVEHDYNTEIQGFLDSNGRFMNRKDAFILAESNGQLNRSNHPKNSYNGNELFSEDIW